VVPHERVAFAGSPETRPASLEESPAAKACDGRHVEDPVQDQHVLALDHRLSSWPLAISAIRM
jgi:hypothetical protein